MRMTGHEIRYSILIYVILDFEIIIKNLASEDILGPICRKILFKKVRQLVKTSTHL